ncbi:MAG: hypothetical protein JNL79_25895 [Myxococcales bacterium]|nr:hypothetical protein [Myxococcales bacterium]
MRRAPRPCASSMERAASSCHSTPARRPCWTRVMRRSPLDIRPERRALRIFAIDPMLGRAGDMRVTIDVPYREIAVDERRFRDDRLELIDYDGATGRYYRVIDLDDARVAMQQGVEPAEADPQFHQQMVYAVASRVLENFDRALGRRLRFWGGQRLRLLPHAFQGRNAYYDQELNAVLFGYFPADQDEPGENLPGQAIFTCLSHDIIAHEVTHAALDRLHRHYREPTNPEVPALHEGFSDIVAVFQRFTFPDVVRQVIRATRGDLLGRPHPLVEIGAQFGAAAGTGHALRSVASVADPKAFARSREPHELGRLLVAAVFEGFVRTFERRTADLLRIATGGSGRLPDGEIHPDLVNRLASECTRTAQSVLMMCIRATDYLPPVDPTFSDFLRAMVTADFELNRADELGLRAAMIEAFRVRGIRPEAVGSFAVESLLLQPIDTKPDGELADLVVRLSTLGARELSRTGALAELPDSPPFKKPVKRVRSPSDFIQQQQSELVSESDDLNETEEPDVQWREIANGLGRWARKNASLMGLETGGIKVDGFHPVHRVAPSGELLVEMVAQLVQSQRPAPELGGLTYRAGVTLVATLDGRVRYAIKKPFHESRYASMLGWVQAFAARGGPSWASSPSPRRISEAFSARAMDGRRWR